MKYRFSKREIKELLISGIVIAFVVSYPEVTPSNFLNSLWIIGAAFFLHEISHKIVAQNFDCWAEYRMWPMGLLFGVLLTLTFGVKILAPGAVMISTSYLGRHGFKFINLSPEELGLIGLSGPIINIVLSIFFRGLYGIYGGSVFRLASLVNVWLALFNLLPVPPLDGSKIAKWDIRILILGIGACLLLMFSL